MKILVISPYFPPSATVAIVRISSLVHQLLDEGHEVTIVRNKYESSIHKLSNADKRLLDLETHTVDIKLNTRFFEASDKYKEKIKAILEVENYDLMIVTVGPFYTIPLCKFVKINYNLKIVLDYRDLWIFDIRNKREFFTPTNVLKKAIYFPIEKNNLKYVDKVVTVTEQWANILKKIYNIKPLVIENGYDDKLLKGIKLTEKKNNKLIIAVFGKLAYYSVDFAVEFLKALKVLQKEYDNLRLIHIGLPEKETIEAIKKSGFNKELYFNTGFVSYKQGIQNLASSDINVIIDIRKSAMGTKFYDYIYVNKPILYIGKKGTQLDKLTQQFENGFSCYTSDEIVESIRNIVNNNYKVLSNKIDLTKYSRSKQNKSYIKIIEDIVRM